jgi:hypothetical protein
MKLKTVRSWSARTGIGFTIRAIVTAGFPGILIVFMSVFIVTGVSRRNLAGVVPMVTTVIVIVTLICGGGAPTGDAVMESKVKHAVSVEGNHMDLIQAMNEVEEDVYGENGYLIYRGGCLDRYAPLHHKCILACLYRARSIGVAPCKECIHGGGHTSVCYFREGDPNE